MLGDGLIVLRNLVALRQIGIKVVLARKDRLGSHGTIEGQASANGKFHCLTIEHRQRTGQTQANRTDIGIGSSSKAGGTAAENLSASGQLDVHFQADDGLVLRHHFGRWRFEES